MRLPHPPPPAKQREEIVEIQYDDRLEEAAGRFVEAMRALGLVVEDISEAGTPHLKYRITTALSLEEHWLRESGEELEASKKKHAAMMERMRTEPPGPDSFPAHVITRTAK